jgi:predicted nuclease of predicted toxin-antitoxin system
MKILLDMNLSPTWVGFLKQAGFEAVHWVSLGSPTASDVEIMEWARLNDHIVFTHDMDFSALLAMTGAIWSERAADPSAGCPAGRNRT